MRRLSTVTVATILLTLTPGDRAAGDELVCPRVSAPPVLDGRLDEAAWGRALRLTARAGKGAEARVCFDAKAIYVAVVCGQAPKGDGVDVWLRTTESSLEFDRLTVDTRSVVQAVRRRQRRDLPPWKPACRAKARVEAERWIVEMRIPLADLGMKPPRAGEMVEIKIGRRGETVGYATVYFERANLLGNPDMSKRDGDRIAAWGFHKGDAGLFSSVADGRAGVIRFRTPGRYTTASQSLRLVPNARYRLEARVKGTAGIYIRARTVPKVGAASIPYTANTRPTEKYVKYEVPFPTGPTGKALILIGNTEGGGEGEVRLADLAVVREKAYERFGPAIPVEVGRVPTTIKKLPVADCRALRGFAGTVVDGTTRSRGWSGSVWEYNQRGTGTGVRYFYRGNDGLHVTLADTGGFHAVLIRGGVRGKLYRDCPRYDTPEGGKLLAEFPGRTNRSRAWFDQPVRTGRVSFFDVTDGRLADVSFFRVRRGGGLPTPVRYGVAAASGDAGPVRAWLEDRFAKTDRRVLPITNTIRKPAALTLAKGQTFHLIGTPLAAETALGAIGVEMTVSDAPTPIPLTISVQDPLNGRCALLTADLVLSQPGACHVVLDFPDQIVFQGAVVWLSVTAHCQARLRGMTVSVYPVKREAAIAEALAYRKLLLKTYFCSLSEPRPWNGWYDDRRLQKSLAEPRWGPQLKQLIVTLDQCKRLGPKDDLVRQYDEWIWRNYRPRRKTVNKIPPLVAKIQPVAGAPQWAVVARQAWLTARSVPQWWLDHRLVPTGEFGGVVGDDTDMYQNYADFPMFETGGTAAAIKDAAARLAELAEAEYLERGLNRRTTDPLHAYEEGMNHLAVMAWWHYGDPVYLERCMVSARSTESLTVVTSEGHRHFKNQDCGAADLRMDRKLGIDGHAHPLMWHPTLEVVWYNRNARALKHLTQWADGWLAHMRPGKYATAVEVATERVVATTHRPLYGGYGALGSVFLQMYWITDDAKYLGPFLEEFRRGRRSTSPGLILPELIHRHGLKFLGGKLRDAAHGEGAAETLLTGEKQPLIDALKADIAELQRFPAMYTTAEPYTDRVFLYAVRNASIAYTGGYAARNKLHHTHAVSWEGLSTDFAALVLRAGRDHLKVLVYNFADRPLRGRMRTWTLDHGRYRVRIGDAAEPADREILRGSAVELALPPRKVTAVELRQRSRLDDERLRADLALSIREVRVDGRVVRAVAHNIGSRRVESFTAALVDERGKVRVRKTLGPLEAPLDLVPRRLPFALEGLPAGAKGWSVALDADGRVGEIYEGNNRVTVRSP